MRYTGLRQCNVGRSSWRAGIGLLVLSALLACGGPGGEGGQAGGQDVRQDGWSDRERAQILSLSLAGLPPPPADPSNAYADDARAVEFGRKLFHDTRLSRNGRVACASCHRPDRHFTDGLPLARGIGQARRHTPSLQAAAWSPWQFWDGRADSLWSQALGPLQDPHEMGLSLAQATAVIQTHHKDDYQALFGRMPRLSTAAPGDIRRVMANTGKALAAFQRSLRPAAAAFDAYAEALRRDDPQADGLLDPAARQGLRLFLGRGQCLRCHHGPLLTNNGFHNTGLAPRAGQAFDPGRVEGIQQALTSIFNCRGPYSDTQPQDCPHLEYARPEAAELLGAFKTPSLRNVAATAPYMHDGRFTTLREVLDHYNRAPGPSLEYGHSELFPLALSEAELGQLEAFLRTLGPAPRTAGAGEPD